MGQLRSAIRALAATGLAPGPLLDALDGFVARHRVGRMATVAYAQLDVTTGELLYACAGHPPPVLLAPQAPPSFLWDGRSVPLDSVALGGPRGQGAAQLARGGTLLLYTDGLVERRRQSLDVGLADLLAEAARHEGEDIAGMLTSVVRAMNDDRSDDLCVLAAHRRGAAGSEAAQSSRHEEEQPMTGKAEFNAEEWSVVAGAPLMSAMMVIAAERGGSVRESVAVAREYAEARERYDGEFMSALLATPPATAVKRPDSPDDLPDAGDRGAARGRRDPRARRHRGRGRRVQALRLLARRSVARAHKEGGFLGVGGKEVSEREQAALDEIAAIFDEEPPPAAA